MTMPAAGAAGWKIPDDWVEFNEAFIIEVQLGLHPGWKYLHDPEEVLYHEPHAWQLDRNRIIGRPVPTIARRRP